MDETKLKPFRPYNIILATPSRKKARWNISTCENLNLGFLGVFLFGKVSNFWKLQVKVSKGLSFIWCQCVQLSPCLLFSNNSSPVIVLFTSPYYFFSSYSFSFMTPSFFTLSSYLYHCHFILFSVFRTLNEAFHN
jgi:hypothetical protein